MAIENTYLLGKNITLGCGFDLQAEAPLDSRQTVPAFAGLQALISGNAAYEGMIVYDEETKKTYQAQKCDGYKFEGNDKTYYIEFREFGINEAELKDLIASETTAAMEFKGAATALPENPAKGDMYKVTASFEVAGETAKVGDSIVYNGEEWFLIPSGDDIEDTWRPVTDVDNDATLTFVAGDKLDVAVAANGTVTYSHEAIDAPVNQNSDEDEPTRTYITQLIADNHGHIIGFKTATETVEDTNTTYDFEGLPVEEGEPAPSSVYFQVKSSDADAAEVIYLDAYNKNEADAKFATKAYVGTIPVDGEGNPLASSVVEYVNEKTKGIATAGNLELLEGRVTGLEGRMDSAEAAIDALEEASATHALKTDVEAVEGELADYISSNNEALAGVKATADAAAVKTDVDTALEGKVAKVDYEADKATFATKTELGDVSDAVTAEENRAKGVESDFETRIAALEGNFGDGEGTVEAQIAAAVKVEEDARKEAVSGVQGEVDGVKGRLDTAEGKISDLETASATHATKDELAGVNAKFANYNDKVTQSGIDVAQDARIKKIEDDYLKAADITDLASKTSVQDVADDLAEYIESNDAAVADRYTKAEADDKFLAKADHVPYDDTAVRGLISANADAIATKVAQSAYDAKVKELADAIATKQDIIPAETYDAFGAAATAESNAKGYTDSKFEEANLAQYTTEQEVKDIVDGVIAGAVDGDTITGLANLVEYLNTHGGEAKEMGAAIDVLEGKVEAIEGKPAYGILSTDIAAWNAEIGAKELAASKTTTAEVKDQIEAYGYATTDYADGKAADAQAAAIADAASKYETKGTAQGIVDGLKLSETYEPIGAETRAIAAAKTETEKQVKALNDGQVTTNKNDIASLFEQMQWGEF